MKEAFLILSPRYEYECECKVVCFLMASLFFLFFLIVCVFLSQSLSKLLESLKAVAGKANARVGRREYMGAADIVALHA